jgi:hypothetical protein
MTTRAGTCYGMEDLQGNDERRGEGANERRDKGTAAVGRRDGSVELGCSRRDDAGSLGRQATTGG